MKFLHLFGCAAAATATGFANFFYFISVGYGLSMAFQAAASLAQHRSKMSRSSLLHGIGLMLYGIRLATFLLERSRKREYKEQVLEKRQEKEVSLSKKLLVWLSCSVLYVLMFTPCNLALKQPVPSKSALVGLPIMYVGLLMEAVADAQKMAFKAKHPDKFCDTGLYSICRHPNYCGELLFWSGNYIATVLLDQSLLDRGAATVGLMAIWGIMMQSTKGLEKKQKSRYGSDPAYKQYVSKTPLLLPFVPLGLVRDSGQPAEGDASGSVPMQDIPKQQETKKQT